MERLITVGLSFLLIALTAPNVKADTKTDAQQTKQPAKVETQAPVGYSMNASDKPNVDLTAQPKLSERDRIIRQYQTQTVIPAQ